MALFPTPGQVARAATRLLAAGQNATEVLVYGGLDTGEKPTPYTVMAAGPHHKLRHYADSDIIGERPPILLVPPLMVATDIYDVSPPVSAVAILESHGVDAWVVDFGAPDREPGGLQRRVADHVLAVSQAVDQVREATGRDVHLAGYSQGGIFCYEAAAYRRCEGIASVITFGSPADTSQPFGLPPEVVANFAKFMIWAGGERSMPPWAARVGFQMITPAKTLRGRLDFVRQLHDREALLPRESQRRFIDGEGWLAWPGPAIKDFVDDLFVHNRMLEGGIAIGDRLVTLADIDCPVLTFVGEQDGVAPPDAVRALYRAAPRAEAYEVGLRAGHMGLVVSRTASQSTWPTAAGWIHWREGTQERPELLAPSGSGQSPSARGGIVGLGVGVAGPVSDAARTLARTGVRSLQTVREIANEAITQFPRLARLEHIQPHTRISIGSLLDEQADRSPDNIFFLYEDRGISHADVKNRVDAVVRGLIAFGVRAGDHVGVLMGTRPTAVAVAVALNRIGAVGVMLRPDGDLECEVNLGEVSRIITDPEHAALAGRVSALPAAVLGGGRDRDVDTSATDLERIDLDTVDLPGWYVPNPGRARDLAFVLFTGAGQDVRPGRITNGRWAMSALGTASSAALTSRDTVYSLAPHHHPAGLLTSVGGAIAGSCRLAMASSFDPNTFWEEARRYGATVVSYTWTMLAGIADTPPSPGEHHHAVRLFIGSGMPAGLWRRVEERFAPARVLEFYAATEAGAVLANVSARKVGALGRLIPGSLPIRVVRYDAVQRQLELGPRGFAIECGTDEVGMLLVRVDHPGRSTNTVRGVFVPGDIWQISGDLVRRDADGDYWLTGSVSSLIHTDKAAVAPGPIQDALEMLPGVRLAVVYGLPATASTELVSAAVQLAPGKRLTRDELNTALAGVEPQQRPTLVHVVDDIPRTDAFRPRTAVLRDAGVPKPQAGLTFYSDAADQYRPLTDATRRRLSGAHDPGTDHEENSNGSPIH
jgi:putative long chain acyl-CoA synthase